MRKQPIPWPCWIRFLSRPFSKDAGESGLSRIAKLAILLGLTAWVSNVLLFNGAPDVIADENAGSPPPAVVRSEDTNAQELLQTILQVQGQLQSNQLAIEQNNRELKEAADQNAAALSNGLKRIENDLSAQQDAFSARSSQELEAIQRSNRSLLLVAGTIASFATLVMLASGFFQWRTSRIWSHLSTLSSAPRPIIHGSIGGAADVGTQRLVQSGPEDSNQRLFGAIEQLEKRIQRLEQDSNPTLRIHAPEPRSGEEAAHAVQSAPTHEVQIATLLAEGQAHLKENSPEAALKCFDQALALNSNHAEALVRKGATLERLKKLSEAFECYDSAIASDAGMTAAYLHKGSLYNRLGRFKDALEYYEKALRVQDK